MLASSKDRLYKRGPLIVPDPSPSIGLNGFVLPVHSPSVEAGRFRPTNGAASNGWQFPRPETVTGMVVPRSAASAPAPTAVHSSFQLSGKPQKPRVLFTPIDVSASPAEH